MKTVSATQSTEDEAWMAEFCAAKCRAAGFCCNDYLVGSNQFVSCAQACMMRARGASVEELVSGQDGGICRRERSCSVQVQGWQYTMCSECSDLTGDSQCAHGVPSVAACEYGASLAAPTSQDYCFFACKAMGYCCNDYTVGSNQMISCAQACRMRALGTPWSELATENEDGLCNRNGASGCHLEENGHDYSFCSTCDDLTESPQCKHGVASPAACDYGASLVSPM